MALISGEITVKGEKYRLLDYRSPKLGEHYLHDGRVYQSLSNFNAIEFIVVEPAPKPWRVPTDEDAKRRPKCRTRNSHESDWIEDGQVLIAVLDAGTFPFVVVRDGLVWWFTFCEIQD